ncbi:ribosomal RNA small subunit methyltransferase A [archaeon]|nr:MAG: ribosomal RNA small subunit methyltransferase A [archaeon]
MFKDPRPLLKRHGLEAKKHHSQNFLISPRVVSVMASYARGTVLEVGPGVGTLTDALAERAERVIAIEKDPYLCSVLEQEYSWANVEVINRDVLEGELPAFDVCISSVPYAISSPLLFKLLDEPFDTLVLLLQREFVDRLVGRGEPSRLTFMAQSMADARNVLAVPRTKFYPPPRVDSAVVEIVPNRKFEVDAWYRRTVEGLLTHKRKRVHNALVDSRAIFNKGKDEMKSIAKNAPHARTRVVELDIHEVREIADYLNSECFEEGG